MTRRLVVFLAGALGAGLAGTAAASGLAVEAGKETFAGRSEGRRFPLELVVGSGDQRTVLRATGSGIRKQLVFDVYEAVMYADTAVALGADPYPQLAEGDFARRLEMHYLHSVDARRHRGATEAGFARVLGDDPPAPALAEDLKRFLQAMGDGGVEENDVVAITWLPGAGLFVTRNGKGDPPIPSPMLAATVMAMWFGSAPVSETLKQDLVRLAVGDLPPPRK